MKKIRVNNKWDTGDDKDMKLEWNQSEEQDKTLIKCESSS